MLKQDAPKSKFVAEFISFFHPKPAPKKVSEKTRASLETWPSIDIDILSNMLGSIAFCETRKSRI